MAWAPKGTFSGSGKKTTGALAVTVTATYATGDVVVLVYASDPGTSTGADGAVTTGLATVADNASLGTNTWVHAQTWRSGASAAGTGVRTSVFYTQITHALVSGNAVTITTVSGVPAKGAQLQGFSVDAASTIALTASTGYAAASTTGLSANLTGLTAGQEYLAVAAQGAQNTVNTAVTGDAAFTAFQANPNGTSGSTAATNIEVKGFYDVFGGVDNVAFTGTNTSIIKAITLVVLAESNPALYYFRVPTVASLALAGVAPTRTVSNNATFTSTPDLVTASPYLTAVPAFAVSGGVTDIPRVPGVASLALTGVAPNKVVAFLDTPAVASLTATGVAPTRITNFPRSPAVASLGFTGTTPVLALSIVTPVRSLTLTSTTPTVVKAFLDTPAVATLTLSAEAPTLEIVSGSVDIPRQPAVASLALSGVTPTRVTALLDTPAAASLTLSGVAPILGVALLDTPAVATLTLSGVTPTRVTASLDTPAVATLTLSGVAPTRVTALFDTPAVASLTLSGAAPAIGISIVVPVASLALSATTPTRAFRVNPPVRVYLNGNAATAVTTAAIPPGSLVIVQTEAGTASSVPTTLSDTTANSYAAITRSAGAWWTGFYRCLKTTDNIPSGTTFTLSSSSGTSAICNIYYIAEATDAAFVDKSNSLNFAGSETTFSLATGALTREYDVVFGGWRSISSANLLTYTEDSKFTTLVSQLPSTQEVDLSFAIAPAGLATFTWAPSWTWQTSYSGDQAAIAAIAVITTAIALTPAEASLALTGPAPSLNIAISNALPAAASLTLTGPAPTKLIGLSPIPAVASLALSTAAPSRLTQFLDTPAAAALTLTGPAPSRTFGGETALSANDFTVGSPKIGVPLVGLSIPYKASGTPVVSAGTVAALNWEYTQAWSCVCYINIPPSSKPISWDTDANIIFSTCNQGSGTAYTGYEFFLSSDSGVYDGVLWVRIISNYGSNWYIGVRGSTDVCDGKTHKIAATYDGSGLVSGVKLYVDDILETMATEYDGLTSHTIVAAQPFTIGNQTGWPFGLGGEIGEFSLSNIERTQGWIQSYTTAAATIDGNVVLAYNFSEQIGRTTADLSGNNRTGTINGAPATWLPSGIVAGILDKPTTASLTLNGPAPTRSVAVTLTPAVATLTLTGPAPTVTSANNIAATPTVAALTLVGPAPTVVATTETAITLDPANTDTTHGTLSGGNLVYTTTVTASYGTSRCILGATTGKKYYEATLSIASGNAMIGAVDATWNVNGNTYLGNGGHSIGLQTGSGAVFTSYGTQSNKGTAINGSVVGVAIDIGASLIWFRIGAGLWNNTVGADPATGTSGLSLGSASGTIYPAVTVNSFGVNHWTVNFGATAYANAVPSGFSSWGGSLFAADFTVGSPSIGVPLFNTDFQAAGITVGSPVIGTPNLYANLIPDGLITESPSFETPTLLINAVTLSAVGIGGYPGPLLTLLLSDTGVSGPMPVFGTPPIITAYWYFETGSITVGSPTIDAAELKFGLTPDNLIVSSPEFTAPGLNIPTITLPLPVGIGGRPGPLLTLLLSDAGVVDISPAFSNPALSWMLTLAPAAANLTLNGTISGFVAGGLVGATPSAATLTLTGPAPILARTQNWYATPTVASLTLTGTTSVLAWTQNWYATPAAATLTLAQETPAVAAGGMRSMVPTVAALTLSSTVSTLAWTQNWYATPTVVALTLSGAAPARLTDHSKTPAVASLTLTGTVSTVDHTTLVAAERIPAVASLGLTGVAPSSLTAHLKVPSVASLGLTGTTSTVAWTQHWYRTPNPAALALAGTVSSIGGATTPAVASLSLSSAAPVASVAILSTRPAVASLGLSTTAPTRVVDRPQSPAVGALGLTGPAPIVAWTQRWYATPDPAVLALEPSSPATGGNMAFQTPVGSLTLTGVAPSIDRQIKPTVASLSLTRSTPVIHKTIVVPAANLVWSGEPPPIFILAGIHCNPDDNVIYLDSDSPLVTRVKLRHWQQRIRLRGTDTGPRTDSGGRPTVTRLRGSK